MKTFFNLHDLTGDGYLDQAELEALFQKELDKVYDKNNKEDDMKERQERSLFLYRRRRSINISSKIGSLIKYIINNQHIIAGRTCFSVNYVYFRDEEEARMRKHVMEEMDANKDGLISMEEFLGMNLRGYVGLLFVSVLTSQFCKLWWAFHSSTLFYVHLK